MCDMARHYSTVSYGRIKRHTVQSPAVSKNNGRERDGMKERRKEGEKESRAKESSQQR